MRNLLEETVSVLIENKKDPVDVLWVGTDDFKTDWFDFAKNADKEYDEDFGCEEVNINLKIVGKDFWLERHEYDGSEWWEYKTLPVEPKINKKLTEEDVFY